MRRAFGSTSVVFLIVLSLMSISQVVFACERGPVFPADMVREADVIVRAQAMGYAAPPSAANWDPPLKFRVVEVIRGRDVPQELQLPGYPSDRDDFNGGPVPYTAVPKAKASCYSRFYRTGAEFLLVMKKYTVEWYAAGPVNEQLHSADDPWLAWVRKAAQQ